MAALREGLQSEFEPSIVGRRSSMLVRPLSSLEKDTYWGPIGSCARTDSKGADGKVPSFTVTKRKSQ